jgi:zinc protease
MLPDVGPPSPVRFPYVSRRTIGNGLRVWSIPHAGVPLVTIALVMEGGTAADPTDQPGLMSLVAALMTEGAGSRDSIAMADAIARIGGQLSVDPGPDAISVTLTTLERHFETALALLSDIVRVPRLAAPDFARVRDLRRGRLTQASRTPGTMADRAFLAAVFGDHPYGHGALGTTRAIETITLDHVAAAWESQWGPARGTLLVSGDVEATRVFQGVDAAFGEWPDRIGPAPRVAPPAAAPDRCVRVVHHAGASQSEIRVGHLGPARSTVHYHALITLNAILGGQFTSRINRNLREGRAITYGARSSFDMRRLGGYFSCETAVQADATAVAIAEILRECRDVMAEAAIAPGELAQAKASLTRGYARQFETAGHLVRAMSQLAIYGLADDAFDRFVPTVESLTADHLLGVARTVLAPDDAAVVVVGDLSLVRASLGESGREVVETVVEF